MSVLFECEPQSSCLLCPGVPLTSWTVSWPPPQLWGPAGCQLRAPQLPWQCAASSPGRPPAENRNQAAQSLGYSAFASLETITDRVRKECQRGAEAVSRMGDGNWEPLRTALRPRSDSTAASADKSRWPASANRSTANCTTWSDMLRPRLPTSVGTTTTKTKVEHGAFRVMS